MEYKKSENLQLCLITHLTPFDQTCLFNPVSILTSGVPIIFSANLRISLMARGARFLNPLQDVNRIQMSYIILVGQDMTVFMQGFVLNLIIKQFYFEVSTLSIAYCRYTFMKGLSSCYDSRKDLTYG